MTGTNWWARVYGHASEQMPFWEGASLEWGKQYALERVKQFVVGVDGANWIHKGVEALGHADSIWTAPISLARVGEAMARILLSTMAYV